MGKHSLLMALGGLLLGIMTARGAMISPEPGNLIRRLDRVPQATATEITQEDVVVENGTSNKCVNGVSTTIHFDQPMTKPILFSCESECEEVPGKPAFTYGIYVDAQYADKSFEYGITATWRTGTHGWERASVVFVPKKPVTDLYVYVMLRWRSGFAAFRNALIRPATPEEVKNATNRR